VDDFTRRWLLPEYGKDDLPVGWGNPFRRPRDGDARPDAQVVPGPGRGVTPWPPHVHRPPDGKRKPNGPGSKDKTE
jgi:hypothetical protein